MKIHRPQDTSLLSDLPEPLKKTHEKVSICDLKHWGKDRDQFWLMVSEDLEPVQVVSEILDKKINHLLQKNHERFFDDVLSAGNLAEDPKGYFQAHYKVFSDPCLGETSLRFSGPEQKQEMKERSLEFVGKLKSAAVLQAADCIIEELYMNAIFDAPQKANLKDPAMKVREAEIFMAYSQKSLQISCSDFFGSLDVEEFLERMKEVYEKGVGQSVNFTTDRSLGAGIGCVILFENCTCLILGVQKSQITKVTCVIPLGIRNQRREEMKKSLHWFQL